ncbi:MAG: transposase [Hyphomicrobiaceae bacterium]|nr:transposase [Hyphomicrobiaceae bacterium]
MREWWTAAEIAKRALPGLPMSKRGIHKLAQREGWLAARAPDGSLLTRTARGGASGIEYHVTLLPEAARIVLAGDAIRPQRPAAAPATDATLLRDARAAILGLHRHYAATAGLSPRAAEDGFAHAYNSGYIAADEWVRAAIKRVSARTLRRWRTDTDGSRLAGRQGRIATPSILEAANDGAVADLIGGALARQPHLTAAHVRALVRATFGDLFEITSDAGEVISVGLPQERAFRRFISAWKWRNQLALTRMTNPDRFKSAYRVSGLARQTVERLNQVWEVDASPADMLCTDGRYQIYALIDIWSRRMIISVSRTPTAEAVLLLVRKAILAWGVPETVKTDNGADFKAHAVRRAFAALGVTHEMCDPFSPEQKGIVERAIGTLQRDLMPLLPGFVGHSVADRKAIEQRKAFAQRLGEKADQAFAVELNSSELQDYADRWADAQYGQAPHSALPQRMSPFARAASHAGRIKRVDDVRALDMLLAPVPGQHGIRTVGKQGIKIDGAFFISSTIMPGEKVLVRHDPSDMGRVYCFQADGARFLAEAICPERLGIERAAAVAAARAEQARVLKEQVEPIRRAAKRIKPRDMIEAVLRQAEKDAGTVLAFPARSDAHTTPALEAAADAATPRAERPREKKLTGKAADTYAQLVAEAEAGTLGRSTDVPASADDEKRRHFEAEFTERAPAHTARAKAARVVDLPETPKHRFRRAYQMEQALAEGVDVPADELVWLGGYRTMPEYAAHKAMLADFGVEWLFG